MADKTTHRRSVPSGHHAPTHGHATNRTSRGRACRKVDPAGAVRTNRSQSLPTVRTNGPFVDPAGVFGDRKVDTVPGVRTFCQPKSGHGGHRAHKPAQNHPYRTHFRAICGHGGGLGGAKSGPGGRRAYFFAPAKWTRCPPCALLRTQNALRRAIPKPKPHVGTSCPPTPHQHAGFFAKWGQRCATLTTWDTRPTPAP